MIIRNWPLAALIASAALLVVGVSGYRKVLWPVVQTCTFNHRLTGSPFPCLKVSLKEGAARGYVVIRAPLEPTHIIVVPTVRIEGIESPQLQSQNAPNYVRDAWNARSYVMAAADRPLVDENIGIAVNSRKGRSQDQLHIHVSCVDRNFVARLAELDRNINDKEWFRLPFAFRARHYWARRLTTRNFDGVNPFAVAATLLRDSPGPLMNLTFAILPSADIGGRGFYLLADQYAPGQRGRGHAEFLLDHRCSAK